MTERDTPPTRAELEELERRTALYRIADMRRRLHPLDHEERDDDD